MDSQNTGTCFIPDYRKTQSQHIMSNIHVQQAFFVISIELFGPMVTPDIKGSFLGFNMANRICILNLR